LRDPLDRGGHGVGVARRYEEGVLLVAEQVRHPADVGADHAETAGHGFDHRYGRVIDIGGVQKDVARAEKIWNLLFEHGSNQANMVLQVQGIRALGDLLVCAVSLVGPDHEQFDFGKARHKPVEHFDREKRIVCLVEGPEPNQLRPRAVEPARRIATQIQTISNNAYIRSEPAKPLLMVRRGRGDDGRR
jgi:hypothetical protein